MRKYIQRLIICVCLPFMLNSVVLGQTLEPLFVGGMMQQTVEGVWHNKSKGWTLELSGSTFTLYDDSDAGCLKSPMTSEEIAALLRYFGWHNDQLMLSFRDDASTIYYFQKMDTVPAACFQDAASSPKAVFDYFWGVMQAHYAFFDLYGVDWEKRRQAFEARIRPDLTDTELFDVLSEMMAGLLDGHLTLEAEIDGEGRRFSPTRTRRLGPSLDEDYKKQRKIKNLGEFHTRWYRNTMKAVRKTVLNKRGQGSLADESIVWGKIGDVGYIKILWMEGYAESESFSMEAEINGAHKVISKVITELADTKTLIVDVAFNRGGLDEVSLAIASHFAKEHVPAYSKVSYKAAVEPQQIFVHPANTVQYLKPVALFTSEITASAGESFTMAMRALPNVTHYGDATFGALSDILPKPLPNGWGLSLSNEIYEDMDGQVWEGRGVEPDEKMIVFDPGNLNKSYLEALVKLARKLEDLHTN
ncbi:MAG: S41 family peptidase [Rhodothermales bacterium]